MSRPLLAACLSLALSAPLPALSDSLGLSWADVYVGLNSDHQKSLALSGDWKISDAHGLQFGLGYADRPPGALLTVDAHLYLAPAPGRKYGFFLGVADLDGEEFTVVQGGVAGMLALSDRTVVQGRAGLGLSDSDLDYLTVSASLSHDLSDRLQVYGSAMLAEFDETAFRAIAHELALGLRYRIGNGASLSLAVVTDGLSGRDGAPSDTRIELGLRWTFGGSGSDDPVADRAFDTLQPVDVLIRRGLF